MIRARTPTAFKPVAAVSFRSAAGLESVFAMSVRRANGLKRAFTQSGAIATVASPPSVSGFAASGGAQTIQTNATIAQPTGGAEPYTYAWTKVSDTGGTWSIQSATSATTRFTCAGVGAGIDFSATFRCTVTDSVGGTGTVDVVADVTNLGSLYL